MVPVWWTSIFGGTSPTQTATSTTFSISQPLGTATTTTVPTGNAIWRALTSDSGNSSVINLYNSQPAWQQQAAARLVAYEHQTSRLAAYERYQFQITRIGDRQLFVPSVPAIITHQEAERRDREALRRAIEEHDVQEAERIRRQIELRERASAEERRLYEERMEAERQRRQQWEQAKSVARELLLEHLTPAQRETFEANGWFVVEGGRSKTQYRIRAAENMVANVDALNRSGGVQHRLCAHVPLGKVPLGDQLLAQKIMLELAEDDFLRTANRHAA